MVASAVTTYYTRHPVPAKPSHCYSRTGLKSAERRAKCDQRAVSSGWEGAEGVQRGGLGGQWRSSGEPRDRLYRPGLGPGRCGSARPLRKPLPARAPLSGSPGPASAAARSLSPAGRHASGATVLRAGSAAPASGKAPSLRPEQLRLAEPRPEPGRPGRGGHGGAPRRLEPQEEASERVA